MLIRYIANACFQIRLASGRTLLTDPWFEGPCQQTWWNFPPVQDELKQAVRASRPDWIYISHLHHDHLQSQSLQGFDRDTPIIIGAMNTPNLRSAMQRLGFKTFIEVPFETMFELEKGGCKIVMFRDFHASTVGDDSLINYDLDTSMYLLDADGTRVFNAVDNTVLAADAARIRQIWGAPHLAMTPYASASLYPMGMIEYDDDQKAQASARVVARAVNGFVDVVEALGAPRVIPAGGEYVLGGPVAGQSRFLPQPVEADLRNALAARGLDHIQLNKLYPGDTVDTADAEAAPTQDRSAPFRGFDGEARVAYAMTLADRRPTYADVAIEPLEPDWARMLRRCAGAFLGRAAKVGYRPEMDLTIQGLDHHSRRPTFRFVMRLDSGESGFDLPVGENGRRTASYNIDERLLFCLMSGLLNWNAMEASGLIGLARTPDVYDNDLHRSIVHFNMLA